MMAISVFHHFHVYFIFQQINDKSQTVVSEWIKTADDKPSGWILSQYFWRSVKWRTQEVTVYFRMRPDIVVLNHK